MNFVINTPTDYQKLAARTINPKNINNKERMMYHAVLGLSAEAGEVSGIFQKEYQDHPIDFNHVKKELGDCLWMIAEACTAMGCAMEDIMKLNIEKLYSRYPDGFEAERSLHRAEGDI